MTKRVLLALIVTGILGFTLFYAGTTAKAYHTSNHGYFYGQTEYGGWWDVWQPSWRGWTGDRWDCWGGDGLAIPYGVDTPDEFINYVTCKLWAGNYRDHIGAAYIISSMTGYWTPDPPDWVVGNWIERVYYAAQNGWIDFYGADSCSQPNTFYQSTRGDIAYYWGCGTGGNAAIIFYGGSSPYIIKRYCANPVGAMEPIPQGWSVAGSATVSDSDSAAAASITTSPGDTLHFTNYLTNQGPGSTGMSYAMFGHGDQGNWTAQYYNNNNLVGSPVFTNQVSSPIYNNFDYGGPGGGVGTDDFSIRYTKTENFAAGTYNFDAVTDDGVRVYIDGVLKVNDWNGHPPTQNSFTQTMTAGDHTIVVEYFEGAVTAYMYFHYYMQLSGVSGTPTLAPGETRPVNYEDVIVPPGATPGTQICRRTWWNWKNSTGAGDLGYGSAGISPPACATVVTNYALVPTINLTTTSGGNTVQQGDQVTFRYFVDNTSPSGTSGTVNCSITGSGSAPTPAAPSTNCPRTFPAATAAPGDGVSPAETFTIGTQPIGSQICRTLTVNPSTSGGGPVSTQRCVIVAKTPYVHFMGGDVWAGGDFTNTSGTCSTATGAKITTLSNATIGAGSAVEYAAFALSSINKFGSGAKALVDSSNFSDPGRFLSFSNNTSTIGNFGAPQHCMDDRSGPYASAPNISGFVDLNKASDIRHATGNLDMSGNIPAGSKQVYYVDGDVTISGNIYYINNSGNPSFTSISQIPSLVVIAKGNIRVDQNATNIDGVFISRGTFFTCYQKPAPPSISTCATQLKVNGAVIANRLDLYRTFGADGTTTAQRQTPAEIFKLGPEVFLNNALNTSTRATITTSDSRELPPRF